MAQYNETVANFQQLYVTNLRDLFNAEQQITKALPKMAQAVSNEDLRDGFQNHLDQTRGQIERLEVIFRELGESPEGHVCKAMQGLLAEGDEFIQTVENPDVLDAALIGAAQKVEHYEISGYGTARAFARLLGYKEQAHLLKETMEEEAKTDERLTKLAESQINWRAQESFSQATLR